MAKIRGIKPEFWTDDAIVELSRDARLLFIGLWNYACDNGHLADKPRQIKMRIFPADDDVNVEALLQELVALDRISRVDGTITIHRFAEHQKPHRTWWTTCDLPGCLRPDGRKTREDNRGTTVEPPEANGGPTDEVRGGDVDGDVDGEGKARRATRIPDDFAVTDEMRQWAEDKGFEHLDLDGITESFFDYWHAKSGKDATKTDWVATWRNWIRREAGFQASRGPSRPVTEPTPLRGMPADPCGRCGAPPEMGHYEGCPEAAA